MVNLMAKEFTHGLMEVSLRANLKMVLSMAKVNGKSLSCLLPNLQHLQRMISLFSSKAITLFTMKVIINWIKKMDTAYSPGPLEIFTKVSIKMMKEKVTVK